MNIESVKTMQWSNFMIMQQIERNLTCENSRDYEAIQEVQNGLKNILEHIDDFGFDN